MRLDNEEQETRVRNLFSTALARHVHRAEQMARLNQQMADEDGVSITIRYGEDVHISIVEDGVNYKPNVTTCETYFSDPAEFDEFVADLFQARMVLQELVRIFKGEG